MKTVWIIGESDDHLEAAFTTQAAAETYLDKARDSSSWWITYIPLNPAEPGPKDPLRGLGGISA